MHTITPEVPSVPFEDFSDNSLYGPQQWSLDSDIVGMYPFPDTPYPFPPPDRPTEPEPDPPPEPDPGDPGTRNLASRAILYAQETIIQADDGGQEDDEPEQIGGLERLAAGPNDLFYLERVLGGGATSWFMEGMVIQANGNDHDPATQPSGDQPVEPEPPQRGSGDGNGQGGQQGGQGGSGGQGNR